MQKIIRKELNLAGKILVLETGSLANQANASILATYGETVVLATVVAQDVQEDIDFFPLSVDYEEKLYAGGKISTSRFIKREGRPSEEAVLTARLIDRSIRPLFPKDYQKEVQVIITVLSVDQENDPDVLSLIATSAALTISNIPWNGPIAGLRIGRQNGGFILNPTEEEKSFSSLDLVLATTKEEIVMIEATANIVDETSLIGALEFGIKEGRPIIDLIEELRKKTGVEKEDYKAATLKVKEEKKVREFIQKSVIKELKMFSQTQEENWFKESLAKLENKFINDKDVPDSDKEKITSKKLADILESEIASFLRRKVLSTKKRIDGRGPDELRPILAKVGLLPRTHGSGLFQRGETQVLSIVTLASPALEQLIEGMAREETKKYMHHYNFPPFSTGEVRRLGAPGRREIGHGALAEKALLPVIPSVEIFPYTIRVVSEVLSSAGSTSMASVCGSTLALMDAGVPIKEPVAGISIGLITDDKDKSNYVTLTDIAYQEDAQGDMDFKVAGTKSGVTAIQMDIKLNGVSTQVLSKAFEQAREARSLIIDKILAAIPEARKDISKYAPTVLVVKINSSKIGDVIGSGGRVINKIISETGAAIDINEEGIVTISSKDKEAARKAAKLIEGIVKEAQVGEEFEGTVKRILPFGAIIELLPGKEGLLHVSNFPLKRGKNLEEAVKIGQKIKVRVAEIDDQNRINLSTPFGSNRSREKEARVDSDFISKRQRSRYKKTHGRRVHKDRY